MKWKVPFAGTEIFWSAEPQGMLIVLFVQIPDLRPIKFSENFADSKEKIQKILDKKEIWPFPSKNDNLPEKDSQWKQRLKQVEDAGYVLWRDPKRNQKWEMRDTKSKCNWKSPEIQPETNITIFKAFSLKWIHNGDGDSLPSSPEGSDDEEEDDPKKDTSTEIEDEV